MDEPPDLGLLFHRLNNQLGIILANAELLEAKVSDEMTRARASQVIASVLDAMSTAREIRLRAVSVSTAACSPGPNREAATAAGNSAVVFFLQHGQRKRWLRCSLTRTVIGGSSAS